MHRMLWMHRMRRMHRMHFYPPTPTTSMETEFFTLTLAEALKVVEAVRAAARHGTEEPHQSVREWARDVLTEAGNIPHWPADPCVIELPARASTRSRSFTVQPGEL